MKREPRTVGELLTLTSQPEQQAAPHETAEQELQRLRAEKAQFERGEEARHLQVLADAARQEARAFVGGLKQ